MVLSCLSLCVIKEVLLVVDEMSGFVKLGGDISAPSQKRALLPFSHF